MNEGSIAFDALDDAAGNIRRALPVLRESLICIMFRASRQGREYNARHVIGWRLTPTTRV